MLNHEVAARRMVSDIVYAYRMIQGDGESPASLRAFCAALNEALAAYQMSIVHQTVKNWEDRRSLPAVYILGALRRNATDWRRDFAIDLLSALMPETIAPVTDVGRRALARSRLDTGPLKPRYGDWWMGE